MPGPISPKGARLSFKLISKLKTLIQNFRRLDVYTDGSHKGRWGSWAYVIVRRGKIIREASGRERKTNSHRMEFQGAIEALKSLSVNQRITLHTDSRVLWSVMKKEMKRRPPNQDQIVILEDLKLKHKISWIWIKAHAGHRFNERCDELCRRARGHYS